MITESLLGAGYFMPLGRWPRWRLFLSTLHISAPGATFWCSFFILFVQAFASQAVNLWYLEATITGTGVSPALIISSPQEVVYSTPSMDMACRFGRSWRSSHLSTSL
jgi:hypothetical protein